MISSARYIACLAVAFSSVMSQNLVSLPNISPLPLTFQQFPPPLPLPNACKSIFDPLCPYSVLKLAKFGAKFKQIVNSNQQLLKIFEKSVSSEESSHLFYQTWHDTLVKAGVTSSESVAEKVADSIKATWDFITEYQLLDAVADGVGVYILDENVLTDLNAFQYANDFANAILKHFPVVVDPLGLNRALSNGITDFLKTLGIFTSERAPAFIFGFTKELYAATGVKDDDSKTTFANIYGIKLFSDTFVDLVAASSILTNIFNLHQSSVAVSTWHDVIYKEAQNLKFNDPEYIANSFSTVLKQTYDDLTPLVFARCFARGYALHLLAHGLLNSGTAIELSQEFANVMEGLAKISPPNANQQTKYQVMTLAFQKFSESHSDLPYGISQLKVILRYIKNYILGSTGIKKRH